MFSVVTGGVLRLEYLADSQRLIATVVYQAKRRLSAEELAELTEYTRGQLLDGIGENFTQHDTYKQRVSVVFDVIDKKNISATQGDR